MADGQLPATARKIDKAKKKGSLARSPELITEASLLWCFFVLGMVLSSTDVLVNWFHRVLTSCLALMDGGTPSVAVIAKLALIGLAPGFALIALVIAGSTALTVVLNQAISGGSPMGLQMLTPNLDRFNPATGLMRIFSGGAWGTAGLALLKLGAALAVLGTILPKAADVVMAASQVPPAAVLQLVGERLQGMGYTLVGTLVAMAALQAVWSKKRWVNELKMTRQEAVDESKDSEGNPLTKRRHRQAHRRLARRRTLAAVASADVVLANPTHVAVALSYKKGRMRAPRVVAKGADLMALRIKEMARGLGVPVIEQPPLARELYASVEVGKEIPLRLYRAVARVIGQIQRWRAPQFASPPRRTV
jgi:flagellar biosynthetic protein FlhB